MTARSVLRVRIGASEIAVPLERVDEIVRMAALESVPGASGMVRGALNLRGEIVIVLDLAPHLAQPAVAGDPSHYIVVARGANGRYGFLCNDTIGVASVDGARCELSAWSGRAAVREVVHVDGRVLPLFDPEALLGDAA